MKTTSSLQLILLATCSLFTFPNSSFGDPHAKVRSEFTITVDLMPPAATPSTASGTVEIKECQKHDSESIRCEIQTTGLAAGTYSVDAVDSAGVAVHLGEFTPVADDPATRTHENELQIMLPDDVDPLSLESITISDATMVVVLEGDPMTARLRFHANVPVTAAAVVSTTTEDEPITRKHGNGKSGKVHGHALAISRIRNDVEDQRHFLFIGFGAPSSATLNLNVDGVAVGTVTSTKQGKVMFKSLPDTVVLAGMSLITLTDETGAIVMQAEF